MIERIVIAVLLAIAIVGSVLLAIAAVRLGTPGR